MNIFSAAGIYDALLYLPLIEMRRTTVEILGRLRREPVLDVCCGTGYQLGMIATLGLFAVGIDLSPAMLRPLRAGSGGVRCAVQDAANLAFRDGAFSLAMISFGLHEKERAIARRVVDEMMRVTAEGGYLLVTDFEITAGTSAFSRRAISCVERIAGKRHYRCFRDYCETGGMKPLLPENGLALLEEHWFASRGIVTRLYGKSARHGRTGDAR